MDQPAGAGTGPDVTALLRAWRRGDERAKDRLLDRLYLELKIMARRQLRHERAAHTLQPTALVHEAYLRLVDQRNADFDDRAHFLAFASTVMRRVLVDHARARLAAKRAHAEVPLTLATGLPELGGRDPELLDLDRSLLRLAAEYPRQARVVEMRFFAGLTEKEIGAALEVTERTVKRDWAFARAWLLDALGTPK
jgi:RNA polymerase sigma factor (TIGR02999 family)